MARGVGLLILAAFVLMFDSAAAFTQNSAATIAKADALKSVRVSSLPGWFEFVSEASRFRILFPGAPKSNNDVSTMKGFTIEDASGHWAAWCSDLGVTAPNNDSLLREKYQHAIAGMVHGNNRLFVSGDVFLNGRLGAEVIIQRSSRVDYIRTFAFGRRLYTLTVTRKRTNHVGSDVPEDVQQFFDSFIYWD